MKRGNFFPFEYSRGSRSACLFVRARFLAVKFFFCRQTFLTWKPAERPALKHANAYLSDAAAGKLPASENGVAAVVKLIAPCGAPRKGGGERGNSRSTTSSRVRGSLRLGTSAAGSGGRSGFRNGAASGGGRSQYGRKQRRRFVSISRLLRRALELRPWFPMGFSASNGCSPAAKWSFPPAPR